MTGEGRTVNIARAPDRAVLLQAVFPEAAAQGGNILFVSTQAYSEDYPSIMEAGGGTYWTIDCEPKVARFGASERHAVGSCWLIGNNRGGSGLIFNASVKKISVVQITNGRQIGDLAALMVGTFHHADRHQL